MRIMQVCGQGQELGDGGIGVDREESTGIKCLALPLPCLPGIAARDVAGGLRSLAQAARGVAALTSDPAVQAIVLDTASDVLDKASSLIEEAKKAAGHPGDPESQQRLAQVRYWEGAALSLSPRPHQQASCDWSKASPTLAEGQLLRSALEISLDPTLSFHPSTSASVRMSQGPS